MAAGTTLDTLTVVAAGLQAVVTSWSLLAPEYVVVQGRSVTLAIDTTSFADLETWCDVLGVRSGQCLEPSPGCHWCPATATGSLAGLPVRLHITLPLTLARRMGQDWTVNHLGIIDGHVPVIPPWGL